MNPTDLSRLMARELATLRDELLAYADEKDIWALPAGVPNSAGTLALHMCGNLRWFVGAQYGATGYVRNRDQEFSRRDVPRAELIEQIQATIDDVTRTLATLDAAALDAPFTLEVNGFRFPAGRFFMHLAAHLAYHLGQVDFHRRIVTGHGASVGALPLGPIAQPAPDAPHAS